MTDLYLVEDHEMVREGMRAVLEAAGHQVVGEAGDPTTAQAGILRERPEVVLLDLHLGSRSGFELLEQLRERSVRVKVIVLTMSDQPRHVSEARRLGVMAYVRKGSPSRELLAAVEAVARSAAPWGPMAQAPTEPDAAPAYGDLSARERQVLAMVARGMSSAAIGEALHLSPKTVDTYRSRLMTKLGLSDVAAVVRWAIREGLVGLDG